MLSRSQSQHMARVNLSVDEWRAFRSAAVIKGVSIADYLGHLVGKELRRVRKRDGKKAAAEERAALLEKAHSRERQVAPLPPYESAAEEERGRSIPSWGG